MSDHREETDDQNQATSNLAWFLTGAMIGATAALLYAPKSGKETRQYLADKTQQGREAVETASGEPRRTDGPVPASAGIGSRRNKALWTRRGSLFS